MELLKDYGPPVFILLIQMLLAWVSWSMRRAFATKADLHGVNKTVTTLGGRVDKVELEMKHMPTKDDLHTLQLELGEAVGEIKLARAEYGSIMGLMTRMEAVVTRHELIFVDAARSR
jgi:hypothetical protein